MKHLTELELSQFADGEQLAQERLAHLEQCEACFGKLGLAMVESAEIQRAAMGDAKQQLASAPLPKGWIAAASFVGIAGLLPVMLKADRVLVSLFHVGRSVRQFGPLVAKGFVASAGPLWPVVLGIGMITLAISATLSVRWAKA